MVQVIGYAFESLHLDLAVILPEYSYFLTFEMIPYIFRHSNYVPEETICYRNLIYGHIYIIMCVYIYFIVIHFCQ